MNSLFLFFQNEQNAKNKLYHSYLNLKEEKEATRLAYNNSLKFIYFIKQGFSYFISAKNSDLIVQPLLLYYGIINLMKSMILLSDPYYPSTTTILQHGMTTRKKKKTEYEFQQDIVKVQKDGLLPYFAESILKDPLITHSRYKVMDLYSMIPELQDSFHLFHSKTMLPVTIKQVDSTQWKFSFLEKDLLYFPLPFSEICSLFQESISMGNHLDLSLEIAKNESTIILHTKFSNYSPVLDHYQILEDYRGNYYFFTSYQLKIKNEIVVFNMLMYILSMLCRYDTEHWGEIIYSYHTDDLLLVKELLQITLRKFPNLILNHLFGEKYIFYT